ncbi:hypothetical protein ElyMa_004971600 [Elysia marginata]|uniref:Uncharacterized protein n=1 Tax=Elysia marginata TaxID=1093978 RepID=A0AAV4J7X8_9GAST|nr:hypothetical protein ElyMa_004971600 [Elysia marginata]
MSNGNEVAFVEFYNMGSSRDEWFDQQFIANSSWGLFFGSLPYMGTEGYYNPPHTARRFNMFKDMMHPCAGNTLFTTVIDQMTDECGNDWGNPTRSGFPVFLYSPHPTEGATVINRTGTGYPMAETADVLAVWVKFI